MHRKPEDFGVESVAELPLRQELINPLICQIHECETEPIMTPDGAYFYVCFAGLSIKTSVDIDEKLNLFNPGEAHYLQLIDVRRFLMDGSLLRQQIIKDGPLWSYSPGKAVSHSFTLVTWQMLIPQLKATWINFEKENR